jgi:hypothetical protein
VADGALDVRAVEDLSEAGGSLFVLSRIAQLEEVRKPYFALRECEHVASIRQGT